MYRIYSNAGGFTRLTGRDESPRLIWIVSIHAEARWVIFIQLRADGGWVVRVAKNLRADPRSASKVLLPACCSLRRHPSSRGSRSSCFSFWP